MSASDRYVLEVFRLNGDPQHKTWVNVSKVRAFQKAMVQLHRFPESVVKITEESLYREEHGLQDRRRKL